MVQTVEANGRTFEFDDGVTTEQIGVALDEFFSAQPAAPTTQPVESPEMAGALSALSATPGVNLGIIEPALAIGSATIGEIAGGITGAATALIPGTAEGSGAGVSERVSQSLTFEPESQTGIENLKSIAKVIQPIADLLERAEKISGDVGFDIAGPIGGAIGASLPTALSELLGLKGVRATKRIAGTEIAEGPKGIIEAGEALDVPVLTTDVQPPTTFPGKFTQQLSEKLGPLGSGSARAKQQAARQEVVETLAKDFNVELDSPLAQDIVNSLNDKSARVLADAAQQRNSAVDSLNGFGDVPTPETSKAIDVQIAKQQRLGAKGNQALVTNLENIKASIDGDFGLVKDIRTEVIDDLKALSRGEDRRAEGSLQQVKSAIDKDLNRFAKNNDPKAASDWRKSNMKFADEFQRTRGTELRRILNSGEATPEVVMPILKGGKRSELNRLNQSLTPEGRASARAAIISDALDESGFMRGDINPDRLATALNRTKRKQAIDVFFSGQDKKQLDGLTRLLDATRRAQQSAAAPQTGIQAVPLLAGGGAGAAFIAEPITTLAVLGPLSGIAKAYESKPFRSLLLKIANSQKGSKIETGLFELSVPAVVSALQAAKSEPETEENNR